LGGRSDIKLIKKKLQYNNINVEEKVFFPGRGKYQLFGEDVPSSAGSSGELLNNINKRLAVEVLLLQMRGAV
jgi:hypothetical protein